MLGPVSVGLVFVVPLFPTPRAGPRPPPRYSTGGAPVCCCFFQIVVNRFPQRGRWFFVLFVLVCFAPVMTCSQSARICVFTCAIFDWYVVWDCVRFSARN